MSAGRLFAAACGILLLSACAREADAPAGFAASANGDVRPWTDAPFDAADGKFTFAIHSDLTGGERDGIYEVAIAQLNLLRPEFVINVGDLVEGGDDIAVVERQWDAFDERANRARAPVFYVAGNHDRTGELMQGVWDRRIGPGYYHFRYRDTLFLVLDTEDNTPDRTREIHELREYALQFADAGDWDRFRETPYSNIPENRAGNITEKQSRYMVDAINENADVRWTFLFMHKAPWLREDLTTFTAIEDALSGRPYTVFHGHVHAYAYEKRRGRDYIQLATTGGVQLPENGRSADHVTLVTVDDQGVDIANLLLEGILDRTGHVPLGGDALCFESTRCPDPQ
ncbi:MAG: metallophosphoesterase [Gammaproteobacteria bacterium]|nr:metallophosphoesterase [Gammaproteobacteria bacterium]